MIALYSALAKKKFHILTTLATFMPGRWELGGRALLYVYKLNLNRKFKKSPIGFLILFEGQANFSFI